MSTPSIVHHTSTPATEFTQVPNAFIRDPRLSPVDFRLILWFASQAEGRVIYQTKIIEETGLSKPTVQSGLKRLTDAQRTPIAWLRRTRRGKDKYGRDSYIYTVDLLAGSADYPVLGNEVSTKNTNENTDATNMPSPEPRVSASDVEAAPANSELTSLVSPYDPKPRHLRKIASLDLDPVEVVSFFNDMHYCTEPDCDTKPRSSSWDAKFSKFVDAYAEDRQEVDFTNHYSMHHDPELQALFALADQSGNDR